MKNKYRIFYEYRGKPRFKYSRTFKRAKFLSLGHRSRIEFKSKKNNKYKRLQ